MTAPAPISNPITTDEYSGLKAANWSSLKHYAKSPAHYRAYIDHPPEPTPAMSLGAALHCLVLEPDKFDGMYAVAPECDRRTKAGKETWSAFEAENMARVILTAEQHDQARAMAKAVLDNRAGVLVRLCEERESAITWTDALTDLACKARLDAFSAHSGVAVDIKTTQDASPAAFARTIATYLYHGQAAFYLDGLAAAGIPVTQFLFVVVEKDPPYGVATYLCSDEMITAGRALVRKFLDTHRECLDAGKWPGYRENIQTIDLPRWAA